METKQLTRAEVEANEYLTRQVRDQAAKIRAELAIDGVARFCGLGYHRTGEAVRRFAFRVLAAKGELHVNPEDSRYYLPGCAA